MLATPQAKKGGTLALDTVHTGRLKKQGTFASPYDNNGDRDIMEDM
jgi:hypothetical protein